MTFFKCNEIDGDWEKKSPSEDPWFYLRVLWVKSDIPENNIFPGNEDSRHTADLPGSPGSIWIMT